MLKGIRAVSEMMSIDKKASPRQPEQGKNQRKSAVYNS